MRRSGNGPDGLLLVDKPTGMTSHAVVSRIRRLCDTRRVGHAGTLDPMATGVLVVGVERATRLLGHLALADKEYRARIRLGQCTVTDDADGEVVAEATTAAVTDEALRDGVRALTGPLLQVPSKISAVKVDGRRSYARVRAGEDVELAARPVTVSRFEVHRAERAAGSGARQLIDLDVTVECSTGTYVRALARDLGAALGVGGHLTALRRTRVGPYRVVDARPLADLEAAAGTPAGPPVLPLSRAAAEAFPRWDVDAERARLIGHGVRVEAPDGLGAGPTAVLDPEGRLVALVEPHDGRVRSLAVFR